MFPEELIEQLSYESRVTLSKENIRSIHLGLGYIVNRLKDQKSALMDKKINKVSDPDVDSCLTGLLRENNNLMILFEKIESFPGDVEIHLF